MRIHSKKSATRDALVAKAEKFLEEVKEEESQIVRKISELARPVSNFSPLIPSSIYLAKAAISV